MPVTLSMTDKNFADLRKIIYDRAGIHFPDGKKYVLESRLGARLLELEIEDYEQYIGFLTMGPYQAEEFQEMFNRITINETSFFRNEPQLDVFEKQILPDLLELRKTTKRLRFWSAACSSGEEPYTLGIIVARALGLRLPDWRIEILGTDISEKVLEQAGEGSYTEYAMRTTPQLVKQRFFKQDGARYLLTDQVKNLVNFQLHNLKDRAAARRFGQFDVIFCRNVMIYFDDAMKEQLMGSFCDQLLDDGTMFIGHSESIRGNQQFTALTIPQGFCYRKTKTIAAKPAA